MVSVVIPALNEGLRIASVVQFARRSERVNEVIVVDDGSIDNTVKQARAAGARVITSSMLGKGASMHDGVQAAAGEVVLFLDGDLEGLHPDLVQRMTEPILSGECEMTKARFGREAGRVTALTAKPLLQVFFPELCRFEQPLGGIVALRREVCRKIRFENDYGVDLGLLIDATMKGVRLMEVDIGHLRHESQSLEALGMMARQVVRTLLDRARRHGRLTGRHMEEVEEVERHTALEFEFQAKSNSGSRGIALFDMDGTLVRGRTAIAAAERHGNLSEIEGLLSCPASDTAEQATRVAAAFRGLRRTDLEGVARDLPLVDGAVETIRVLRKAGYLVGIVTDSYRIAAEIVRRRVFADFSVANLLRFSDGRATGEVTLSPLFTSTDGCREHTWCKGNALRHLSERYEIPTSRFLSVGDNSNDLCMLRLAGMPFAFEPKCPELSEIATVVTGNLRGVLRSTRSLFAVA